MLYLVSDESAYVTGTNLVIDGGIAAGRRHLGGRSVLVKADRALGARAGRVARGVHLVARHVDDLTADVTKPSSSSSSSRSGATV